MPIALQSLYSQLWERGGEQMGLKFCLEYLQTGFHYFSSTEKS